MKIIHVLKYCVSQYIFVQLFFATQYTEHIVFNAMESFLICIYLYYFYRLFLKTELKMKYLECRTIFIKNIICTPFCSYFTIPGEYIVRKVLFLLLLFSIFTNIRCTCSYCSLHITLQLQSQNF